MTRVLVSESLMQQTRKRVGALSAGQLISLQLQRFDARAELFAFVIASESQLRREAAELVHYC